MTIIVSPAARDDIRAAYTYYAERNPDAAGRVVRSIWNAISGLAQFPLLGRVGVVPGTRERILTRYPYKIVYEINGETIEVDRVLHTSQQWP
ncbi:MAG TPA: type II toxin-antitoxin system RelE/ParE family toxin [Chloroflexota bacterium]|jgi:plasmid stabilization system protein ParE|nr:type II toxin-antitoxin system RelE/ParE family toxin [Chloroflexota bacterium]